MKSTTKIVTKLCRCGRIMENVPQQRVLCEVCRKEQEKQKLEAHRSPYVRDTARRASRPRAKSQPYKSIEQCVREAKALGISYGQFVARGLDRM